MINIFKKKLIRNCKNTIKLLCFSDYRIQDINLLEKKIDELNLELDAILYAGDDTERFIEKNDNRTINHFEILAKKTRFGLGAVIGNDCNSKNLMSTMSYYIDML